MKEYKLLIRDSDTLEKDVNNRLSMGWEPLGRPILITPPSITGTLAIFAQALVRSTPKVPVFEA